MNINETDVKPMSINQQVLHMRLAQIEDEIELFNLKTASADFEGDTLFAISAEVNEAGKPVFSNADKRETEQKNRLRENSAYQHIQVERKTLEKQIKTNAAKIEYLVFEMKLSMSDKSTSDAIDRLTDTITKGININK